MTLFDPARLPPPSVLSRRHRALLLVEEALDPDEEYPRSHDWDGADGRGTWEDHEGNDYGLYDRGQRALLWVFDHESPFSPWVDDRDEWPGMFEGLPVDLRALLDTEHDEILKSITLCVWFAEGAWHAGRPELPDRDDLASSSDPQGAELLGPLVADEDVATRLSEVHERPELAAAAVAVVSAAGRGNPLGTALLAPLASDAASADELVARAAELGLPSA